MNKVNKRQCSTHGKADSNTIWQLLNAFNNTNDACISLHEKLYCMFDQYVLVSSYSSDKKKYPL